METPLEPLHLRDQTSEEYKTAHRQFAYRRACFWYFIVLVFASLVLTLVIYLATSKDEIERNSAVWGASAIGTDVCCRGTPESCGAPNGALTLCTVCNATQRCINNSCRV